MLLEQPYTVVVYVIYNHCISRCEAVFAITPSDEALSIHFDGVSPDVVLDVAPIIKV